MNRILTLIKFVFKTQGLYRLDIDGKIIYAKIIQLNYGCFSPFLIEHTNLKVGSRSTKSKIMGYSSELKMIKYILKGQLTKIC
jgi:hypothetical protein